VTVRNTNYQDDKPKSRKLFRRMKLAGVSVSLYVITGCFSTSVYKFQSQPSDAAVYYVNGADRTLIGQTPIDYTKASLPTDAPFSLVFEKAGFEPREITVSPTDNTQTTVSASLKPAKDPVIDAGTKRIRDVLRKIFEIQEMTARQRYVDALASLNKLEEQEPKVAEIYSLKGSVYLILNDSTQAKANWEKALKLDPSLDSLRSRIKALSVPVKGANP